MATHNAQAGTGGLDGSIMFETERPENIGAAFNNSLSFFNNFHTTRSSISDLIALGTYSAVRNCNGPRIPIRVGRVDATEAGPEGVPEPQDDLTSIVTQFASMGFSQQDMIQMIACGHSAFNSVVHKSLTDCLLALGGVHGNDFPDMVGNSSAVAFEHFDTTFDNFDSTVVTEYLKDTTENLLVRGPSETNSDLRVFSSDGNKTMEAMADNTTFLTTCASIFERMINTVPKTVTLTEPLSPLAVKPVSPTLLLNNDGTITFAGWIRVGLTGRTDRNLTVAMPYATADGATGSDNVITTTQETASGGGGSGLGGDFTYSVCNLS